MAEDLYYISYILEEDCNVTKCGTGKGVWMVAILPTSYVVWWMSNNLPKEEFIYVQAKGAYCGLMTDSQTALNYTIQQTLHAK